MNPAGRGMRARYNNKWFPKHNSAWSFCRCLVTPVDALVTRCKLTVSCHTSDTQTLDKRKENDYELCTLDSFVCIVTHSVDFLNAEMSAEKFWRGPKCHGAG